MELKDAFKELARFAEARARGAAVVLGNGRRLDGTDGFTGLGVDAYTFMSHTIKEIIEPKVLRDWTAEDAKKFEGYAFRMAGGDSMWIMRKSFAGLPGSWVGYEYAAPIPGTDPATWDWKPCKVEVPAPEAEKATAASLAASAMLALSNLVIDFDKGCQSFLPSNAASDYKQQASKIMSYLERIL